MYCITTFLSSCRYKKDTSEIILSFDPNLRPYLLQLQSNFTKYHLENILTLKSFYAVRIYELCKQYEILKKRIIEIEDLKKILQITAKSYNRYDNFKRKVLEIAKREINEKTDIQITFEEIKTGRKVTAIKFIIAKKDKSKLKIKESRQREYSKEVLTLFEKVKEAEKIESIKELIGKLLKKHSYKVVESNISYSNRKSDTNYQAYLQNAINSDYAKVNREKEILKKKSKEIQEKVEKERAAERLKEEEEYKKLDLLYEEKSEKEKEEIYNVALKLMKKDGHNMANKRILKIMFNTAYKLKSMR
ncbi:MAG: hypothetical protein B6I28_05770 [Fusobacteriia bacterium 4572_132]|nr:MAG: hypothetical protein B6I28_05770 [Fusobacteriia bacterium 4572_132]